MIGDGYVQRVPPLIFTCLLGQAANGARQPATPMAAFLNIFRGNQLLPKPWFYIDLQCTFPRDAWYKHSLQSYASIIIYFSYQCLVWGLEIRVVSCGYWILLKRVFSSSSVVRCFTPVSFCPLRACQASGSPASKIHRTWVSDHCDSKCSCSIVHLPEAVF